MDSNRDDLWEILEKYSETRLFRDWNDPEVNAELRRMAAEIEDWARRAVWSDEKRNRREMGKDVMVGMTKVSTRQEEVWVDECTHEGGKEMAPVKDITPLVEYLLEQGWRKDNSSSSCSSCSRDISSPPPWNCKTPGKHTVVPRLS